VIRIFQEKISKAKDLYKQKEYEKALNLFYELKEEDRQLFESTCNFHYMWCVYQKSGKNTPTSNRSVGGGMNCLKERVFGIIT